jgi:hypothetical protein
MFEGDRDRRPHANKAGTQQTDTGSDGRADRPRVSTRSGWASGAVGELFF